jgi:CRISPR-associated protein Cas2
MLMTYDVDAKRTDKFKRLLRRYLIHTQYSVFSGDISESKAIELRRSLSQFMRAGDRVLEITCENRHNIAVVHMSKSESDKGEIRRDSSNEHRQDFGVL